MRLQGLACSQYNNERNLFVGEKARLSLAVLPDSSSIPDVPQVSFHRFDDAIPVGSNLVNMLVK
eukprot:4365200-Amphidinium_carterae.1